MNEVYSQLNLTFKSTGYHLIAFNNQDVGKVRFQQNHSLLDSDGVWEKVKAYVDGKIVDGYLDVSNLKPNIDGYLSKTTNFFSYIFNKIKYFIIDDEEQIIKNSRIINDLAIQRLSISSEDKYLLYSLMHLGINYDEYLKSPYATICKYFNEFDIKETNSSVEEKDVLHLFFKFKDTINNKKIIHRTFDEIKKKKEKINQFYLYFISANNKEQIILKKIFCDFISKNKNIINFMTFWPKPLFSNKDIMLAAINNDEYAFNYVSADLKTDKDLILAATVTNANNIKLASEDLKHDKKFMLSAVNKHWSSIDFASDALKNDKDILIAAIKQNAIAIKFASDALKADKNFILAAIKENTQVINVLYKNFTDYEVVINDKDILIAGIRKNWGIINYAASNLQNDPEVKDIASKAAFFKIITISLINETTTKKLIDGLEKYKYLYNKEVYKYIEACMIKSSNLDKLKQSLKKNLITDDLISHIEIEADYLKSLNFKNPRTLKFISIIVQEIFKYDDQETRINLINTINVQINKEEELKINFLEKLLTISNCEKPLIIPSIILSTLNIGKHEQIELSEGLKRNKLIFKNKFNPHLQKFIDLTEKLTKTIPISYENKIADILKELLYTTDSNELLSRLNLLRFITEIDNKKIYFIEDFSSSGLLKTLINPLIKSGVLQNTPEFIWMFKDKFLKSRSPYSIFTYTNKFIKDEEMLIIIKKFIYEVANETYLNYRHYNNSHKHLLTQEQKLIWETGSGKTLDYCKSEDLVFDPLEFLKTKLSIDHHSNKKLNKIISIIESEAIISNPNKIEQLCIDLINKKKPAEHLYILKEMKMTLESDGYKDTKFLNDVKAQINLIENQNIDFNLFIKDTEDWQDLFLCGTEVGNSCQKIDGKAELNKGLLGYVLDGKIRMIKIEKKDGSILARSIIKIMKDPSNNPTLFLEKPYPNNKYTLYIKEFAKKKAETLGMSIYESDGLIKLQSEGNTTKFEYSNAGGKITDGSYIINAKLMT